MQVRFRVRKATLAKRVLLAQRVHKAKLAQRVLLAPPEQTQPLPGLRVLRGLMALKVLLVLTALPGHKDLLA
jgi:hypothetical protein